MKTQKEQLLLNSATDGEHIEQSQSIKILGVHIDEKLTLGLHISEKICTRVSKQIGVLNRLKNLKSAIIPHLT